MNQGKDASSFKCLWCTNVYTNIGQLQFHLQTQHASLFQPTTPPVAEPEGSFITFHKHKSSIKGFYVTLHANVEQHKLNDISAFFELAFSDIANCISSQLVQRKFLRLFITLEC